MARRLAAIVVVFAGCGRMRFDPIGDASIERAITVRTYVKASNTGSRDAFGRVALSTDGSTLAVGAPNEASGIAGNQADNSAPDTGAVYVFTRVGTTWAQQAYVKASNPTSGFGGSVALSADGSLLAVGAPHEASNSGAVYVFTRNGTAWVEQAYLKASNAGADDFFGNSIALSSDGSVLAAGAPGEASRATGIDGNQADNTALEAGAVYVLTRAGTTWSQQAYVKASNTGAGDGFGYTIALSSDGATLAVGAETESSAATGINGVQADDSAMFAGAVYVFTRNGTWAQQAYVKASNTRAGYRFGHCVALSADGATLAIGSPGEAGAAIGIDGDQTDNTAANAGASYLFTRVGATWSQRAYVKASNTSAGDAFGFSIAVSADGSTLGVGAPFEQSAATGFGGDERDNTAGSAGAVYLFTNASPWTQRSYVKATNTDAGDFFGEAVALSSAGSALAVAAINEASAATGIDGNQADNSMTGAGAVYVFDAN